MEELVFGPTGVRVPAAGIGTWMMERDRRADAIAAIRRAVELGMTHVDTAEMYGTGRVEEIVGEAIRGLRDRVFLVSKVLPQNASAAGTVKACERTLARLGTDALDCYLLHWPGSQPLSATIAAFEKLKKAGKIRSWGLSNFDVPGLEKALDLAGPGAIACNQVLYNLEERTVEHEVIPWCGRNRIALVAYSPLGAQRFPRSEALERLAAARGATTRQLALAFLLRRPSVFVIPKSSNVAHVEENRAAADLTLTDDEVRSIEAAFPPGPWRGLATA